MERLSAEVHRDYRQSSEKFDYFLTGVTIAICGYLIQTYDSSGLKNFDVVTIFGMLSICLFLISILFSLQRLEKLIQGKRNNYDYLKANERIGDISRSAASGETILLDKKPANQKTILKELDKCDERIAVLVNEMNQLADSAQWLYSARNNTLLLGIASQFITRILDGIL